MKLKPALAVCLFSITAAFSAHAVAASDTPTDAKTDAGKEQADVTKKIKPHSHLDEKMGGGVSKAKEAAPDAATDAAPAKPKAKPAKNKNNHFHPRDGGKS